MKRSLENWVRDGGFDGVSLKATRGEVRTQLGAPTDWSVEDNKSRQPVVWAYDGVELHFSEDERVWLIFCDNFHLRGGHDDGVFGSDLTLANAKNELQRFDIAFEERAAPHLDDGSILRAENGAELAFTTDKGNGEHWPEARLCSISQQVNPDDSRVAGNVGRSA